MKEFVPNCLICQQVKIDTILLSCLEIITITY